MRAKALLMTLAAAAACGDGSSIDLQLAACETQSNAPVVRSFEMSATSFVYSERDPEGNLSPPEARVHFGENIQGQHRLDMTLADEEFSCPLIWQDVAHLKDGSQGGKVPVFGYAGCPIVAAPLAVNDDAELRETTRILIASADGNVLRVASGSAAPWLNQNGDYFAAEMFINAVWEFEKARTKFTTGAADYETTTDGATIAFTRGGIVTEGISGCIRNTEGG